MTRYGRWRCGVLAMVLPVSAACPAQTPVETEQALRRVAAIADDPLSMRTGPGWTLALSAGWRVQRDNGKWRVVEGQPEACED